MPVRCLLLFAALTLVAAAPPPPRTKAEPIIDVQGAVRIAGNRVEYTATSGRLPVKDRTGKAGANIFFVAYTKKGVERLESRPLTFCFNGGPGSSAVWLHMGAFGPRRVLLADDGRSAPMPARVIENEWSLLDVTDLVFIDPVSTGYSRPDDDKDAKLFHGVEEDVSSVGDFIRGYVARYKRAASPTYLAGESYGTTRAAALSSHLQDRLKMKLAGVLLISSVLDWQSIRFGDGNDQPYALYLPTYTATAWYHKKIDRTTTGDLAKAVEASRRFAEGDYAQALRKGNRLTDAERQSTARQLARLTGLPEKLIQAMNLRVSGPAFSRELLRETGEVAGRFDSRVTASARLKRGDPSDVAMRPVFTAGMNAYLPGGLKYASPMRYEILNPRVQPWNFGPAGTNQYLNVAPRLRAAMLKNPALRVFVANGYYDLATPFGGTEHTLAHLGPRALTERVTMAYYEAGHMMYTSKECLKQLKADIAKFMGAKAEVAE